MERRMHMNHRKIRTLLGDYAAGELNAAERELLGAHLQVCAACRKDLATIMQIRSRLRSLALPTGALIDGAPLSAGNATLPALPDYESLKHRISRPERAGNENSRRPARRTATILIAAALVCCLLLSAVTIFSLASPLNTHTARPHPTATPTYSCPTPNTSTPTHIVSPTPGNPTPTPTPSAASIHGGASPTIAAPSPEGCAPPTPTSASSPTPTPTVNSLP